MNIEIIQSHLIPELLKKYNLTKDQILDTIQKHLTKNISLLKLLEQIESYRSLQKRKEFKAFYKKLKKELYYQARTYYRNQTNVANVTDQHVSTAERQPHITEFIQPIKKYLQDVRLVVDIGAGIFPLQIAQKHLPHIQTYLAIDKDKKAITILEEHKIRWLKPLNIRIENINWNDILTQYTDNKLFDVAFLLKTIPVALRLGDQRTIDILRNIPAKVIIISGNRYALAKKQKIEHREEKLILNFIKNTNWLLLEKYKTQNETVFIVKTT